MSFGDVFVSAFSDHLASWRKLKKRAAGGSREAFLEVLNSVPDVEPEAATWYQSVPSSDWASLA